MGMEARLRSISAHVRPRVCSQTPAATGVARAGARGPVAASTSEFGCIDIAASEIEATGASDPLARLACNEIGAIIMRGALPLAVCQQVLQRVHDRGMVPPSYVPFMDLREPAGIEPSDAWTADLQDSLDNDSEAAGRFDIGLSLAGGSADPTGYFERCVGTQAVYGDLFEGLPLELQPQHVMYDALGALTGRSKRAVTAYERDGRQYGACIIRTHKPEHDGLAGASYSLHYDSVRLREQRRGWEVYRFPVQLAGILVLQAPERIPAGLASSTDRVEPVYHDSVMYQYSGDKAVENGYSSPARNPRWPNDVDNDKMRPLVDSGVVPSTTVDLAIGDMYFFKSDSVHEAAGFGGSRARSVLCTFIGYDPGDEEIFVWS
jgi:hypothetical protein